MFLTEWHARTAATTTVVEEVVVTGGFFSFGGHLEISVGLTKYTEYSTESGYLHYIICCGIHACTWWDGVDDIQWILYSIVVRVVTGWLHTIRMIWWGARKKWEHFLVRCALHNVILAFIYLFLGLSCCRLWCIVCIRGCVLWKGAWQKDYLYARSSSLAVRGGCCWWDGWRLVGFPSDLHGGRAGKKNGIGSVRIGKEFGSVSHSVWPVYDTS